MRKFKFHLQAIALVSVIFPLALIAGPLFAGDSDSSIGVPASKAASYIHAVIEADRTIYSEVIVQRLAVTISLKASESWKRDNTLLLPAQFLSLASQMVKDKGIGMDYKLMSLWPINPDNGPKSKFEKNALNAVLDNPDKARTGIISVRGKRIYQAVYPDLAVTKACVTCHNKHPKSPKRDFKLGDVMGGIIINLPVEENEKNKKDPSIAPEVVADYIHSVLEADRTVYANFIVNRLQDKNITYASEHWWEENALLLPAQFLLNASDLIIGQRLGLDVKLISLWPINNHNRAANEFEHRGLEYVARNPVRPFVGTSKVGGRTYFQAVYPDFAVTPACASCHNAHPNSPKRDFKLNDVMGGIVLTFPMD